MAKRAQIDHASEKDIWVENLYYGDGSKALSETEMDFLNSAAATPAASKAAIHNSSGQLVHNRTIVADGADITLTAADSGALCVFDKTDGAQFTLPAAAAGLYFDFVYAASNASGSYKTICAAADFILGSILMDDGDTGLTTTAAAFNGTTHLAVVSNATTSGGLAGGFYRLSAISASQWIIQGHLLHTGNVASPASTS